ncbi:Alpha-latrocrustotoxin-Lt1a [Fusarium avenaceum]|nr:Alpha-latrocrustotoxin-Lt1a [Fusarium avenaceum]
MAPIEALPVEAICRIADIRIDESASKNKDVMQTPEALVQTSHHFYDIVNPRIRTTAVCRAAEEGRLDIIKKAHGHGADLSLAGRIKHGQRASPLHYAIQNGHRDIVEYLVEVGVDPHVPSAGLCTCYMDEAIVKPYALHTALSHSMVKEAAKLLIQKLGAYWSFRGMPALDEVYPDEHDKELADLLINLPGPQPAIDALRYALQWKHSDLATRVLERPDFDASFPDHYGRTPIACAVFYNQPEIFKLLLQRPEVDAGTPQKNGLTPLHLTVEERSLPFVETLLQRTEVDAGKADKHNYTALHCAAEKGELAIVKLLLEQPGVIATSPDNTGMTPLHWAVRSRNHTSHPWLPMRKRIFRCNGPPGFRAQSLDIIKILLARPDINATPLHIAASSRLRSGMKLMGLLLEQRGVDITDVDNDGRTILHYLCGSHEQFYPPDLVIETALREGVPIDEISVNGLTAFHQALCSGNFVTALFLLSLGADPMHELMDELIRKAIEIDTYTDSPLANVWKDDEYRIEDVDGILSVDPVTGSDCTPLLLAALGEYRLEGLKSLLHAGADPNAPVIVRNIELEGSTESNRQAFLSGVFRETWDVEPSDDDMIQNEKPFKVLLQYGPRLDYDGIADSPLQDACKAAEYGLYALLKILLDNSTAKNVSQSHVKEVISEYADKDQHSRIVDMLTEFEHKVFAN